MGVSGSGKSTVGRLLAARYSAPFLEGDEFHPPRNLQKMRGEIPLEDEDRFPWLDRFALEVAVAGAENRLVVGACSALKQVYRNRLRERIVVPVLFVCLDANEEVLIARLRARTGHFMPPALLSSQLATLEPPDASEFALCFDSTKPVDELLVQVDAMLRTRH